MARVPESGDRASLSGLYTALVFMCFCITPTPAEVASETSISCTCRPASEPAPLSTKEPVSGLVAFTAKLNIADSYPSFSGILKFRTVLINEGEGYNPDTGIFTCPMDGLYHFTVHMSVYGRAECAIQKNGEKVVSMYHTNLPDKRSQLASIGSVVKLSINDTVWVYTWGPGRNDFFATESNDSVFIGVRLG